MTAYLEAQRNLEQRRYTWLVTGAAGFIGSHLLETLLRLNQSVIGLDNFSTGYRRNLEQVQARLTQEQWRGFKFLEGDIRSEADCHRACAEVDFVLHEAALGSVPRSIENPILTNAANVTGFVNILVAARDAGVKRLIYAASSSTYGDSSTLPKVEDRIGKPLSPYAVTKYANELYADVFASCYGLQSIGLRYFNVFGPRQDPGGAYAAVIPKWVAEMIKGEPIQIQGDGATSRDFCYVDNAVQANLLAALTENSAAINQVYNVAVGARTTLNELFSAMRNLLAPRLPGLASRQPCYVSFRPGDVRHSQANIQKAAELLGYKPTHTVEAGLAAAMDWYVQDLSRA
jgi:UDP-N-acetylglucosamine/UDP-N-acetylgalactosamine 4-epimerase